MSHKVNETLLKNNSLLHKTIEYREQTRAVLQNQLMPYDEIA